MARRIVRAARVRPGELVLDLGAGTGALTAPLARAGARVLAVERDPRLVGALRRKCADLDQVRVIQCDLLSLAPPREPFRVVANPPFSIVMALLGRLLDDSRSQLRQADLVVPWSLAVRLSRTSRQGRRASNWQRRCTFRLAARLDRSDFSPPPSVATAVLVLRRYR